MKSTWPISPNPFYSNPNRTRMLDPAAPLLKVPCALEPAYEIEPGKLGQRVPLIFCHAIVALSIATSMLFPCLFQDDRQGVEAHGIEYILDEMRIAGIVTHQRIFYHKNLVIQIGGAMVGGQHAAHGAQAA